MSPEDTLRTFCRNAPAGVHVRVDATDTIPSRSVPQDGTAIRLHPRTPALTAMLGEVVCDYIETHLDDLWDSDDPGHEDRYRHQPAEVYADALTAQIDQPDADTRTPGAQIAAAAHAMWHATTQPTL